jgi:hypothetical protein
MIDIRSIVFLTKLFSSFSAEIHKMSSSSSASSASSSSTKTKDNEKDKDAKTKRAELLAYLNKKLREEMQKSFPETSFSVEADAKEWLAK